MFSQSLAGAIAAALAVTAIPVSAGAPASPAAPPAFARCASCHATAKGARHGIGPNLSGVAGNKAASRAGYVYSPALKKSGIVWTNAELQRFLAGPAARVPGTKMGTPPVTSAADRAAIIAFLAKLK